MNVNMKILIAIPELYFLMITMLMADWLVFIILIVIFNIDIATEIFLNLLMKHRKLIHFLTNHPNNPLPFHYNTK